MEPTVASTRISAINMSKTSDRGRSAGTLLEGEWNRENYQDGDAGRDRRYYVLCADTARRYLEQGDPDCGVSQSAFDRTQQQQDLCGSEGGADRQYRQSGGDDW